MSNKDTSNNQESTELEQQTQEPLAESESSKQTSAKPNKKGSPVKWFFVLIILAGLAYAGFLIWQQWQEQQAQSEQTSQTEQQFAQLQGQINSQQQAFTNLQANHNQLAQQQDTRLSSLQREIENLRAELGASQRKLQMINSDQQQEWKLAEIQFLIKQASQKLYFSDDLNSIIALLKTADQQVTSLADSQLLNLRQALAQDIQALQSIQSLDLDGIMLQLKALKSAVSELELASVQLDSEPAETQPTPSSSQEDEDTSIWQRFSSKVDNSLSKYYRVHRYKESVKPFISPNQGELLRQNMLMNLQIAQISALRKDQANYRAALDELSQWSIQYFKQDQAASRGFNQKLSQLAQVNFSQNKPQQLTAEPLIKQIIQARLSHWLSPATTIDASVQPEPAAEAVTPEASQEAETTEQEPEQEGDQ